ncbi:MAG: PaaI family thioesterase [Bacillota bacterium]
MEFYYDHMCFACGEKNPIGLHLKFTVEGDKVKTTFTPQNQHEGYPGIMHGGLISTILDEVMARNVNTLGLHGVTARMEIRFREPAPTGEELTFEAKIVNARKSVVDLEAKASLASGKTVAEALARFMIMGKMDDGKNPGE